MSGKLRKYHDESYVHFITAVTFNRQPYFQDSQMCQILAANIRFYQQKFDLEVYGWVIMPDHLHLLVWWDVEKQPELTISRVMHGIKWHSAKQISEYILGRSGATARPAEMSSHGARAVPTHSVGQLDVKVGSGYIVGRSGASARPAEIYSHGTGAVATRAVKRLKVWQPGFYDFNIYTEKKLQQKIDYLKTNVIAAGLADDWQDYQWIYVKYG